MEESIQIPPEAAVAPEPEIPEPTIEVPALSIDLLENCAKITDKNGMSKLVTLDSLAAALVSFLNQAGESSGKTEHFSPNLIYRERTPSSMYMLYYYPECHRRFQYLSNHIFEKVVVPNIVIGISLTKNGDEWRVTSATYMATKLGLTQISRGRLATNMLRNGSYTTMPFTNVYNDGRLCYGGNSMPSRVSEDDFRPLAWYYEVLWNSPFNDDLGIYSLRDLGGRFRNYIDWFTYLAELANEGKPFPYDELKWD